MCIVQVFQNERSGRREDECMPHLHQLHNAFEGALTQVHGILIMMGGIITW